MLMFLGSDFNTNMGPVYTNQFVLQKQIMDVQRHVQNLQEQIQNCILEPGPETAQQVLNLHHQGAVAQGLLQQLYLQYSQVMLADNASTQTMNPGQLQTATHPSLTVTVPSTPPPTFPAANNNTAPLPQTYPAMKDSPTQLALPLGDVPMIPSISAGPRQRSLSQTLDEMGFQEATICPTPLVNPLMAEPTSKPSKSSKSLKNTTKKPRSRQHQPKESPAGFIVSAGDVFSKMGNKPHSKPQQSKAPAPSEESDSNGGMVFSTNSALSRMGNKKPGSTNDASRTLESKDGIVFSTNDVFSRMEKKMPEPADDTDEDMPLDSLVSRRRSRTPDPANDTDKDMPIGVNSGMNMQQSPRPFWVLHLLRVLRPFGFLLHLPPLRDQPLTRSRQT